MEDGFVEPGFSSFENPESSSFPLASWHTLITLELAETKEAMRKLFEFVDRFLLGKVMVKTFWRAEKLLVAEFSAGCYLKRNHILMEKSSSQRCWD